MFNANTIPSRNMRIYDLQDIAKALGLTGIHGTSKDALCIMIRRAQAARSAA